MRNYSYLVNLSIGTRYKITKKSRETNPIETEIPPCPALYAATWRNTLIILLIFNSYYPSTPDYPDTTVQSSLYPLQTPFQYSFVEYIT